MEEARIRKILTELPVEEAAPILLGCVLCHGVLRATIVEVEAYSGTRDPGSHAFRGRPTARTQTMFGEAGHAYIYFTYGNHWMLNVSAGERGEAAGVLIRGAVPISGVEAMRERRPRAKTDRELLNGPGKLCAAFAIDRRLEGTDLLDPTSPLKIEPGDPPKEILIGPRIGLAHGRAHDYPWRFIHAELRNWASRPKPPEQQPQQFESPASTKDVE